jgi:hypothetical protein
VLKKIFPRDSRTKWTVAIGVTPMRWSRHIDMAKWALPG